MKLSRGKIIIFRVLLLIAVSLVTYLATTAQEYTVVTSSYDKMHHFVAFIVLAFLLDFSFPDSGFNEIKIVLLIAYGLSLEIIQHFLPYRMFSLIDVVADIIGLTSYGLLIPAVKNIPLLSLRWEKE